MGQEVASLVQPKGRVVANIRRYTLKMRGEKHLHAASAAYISTSTDMRLMRSSGEMHSVDRSTRKM